MSTDSKIEWTRHTFNPWWGCTKVHDGCKHCYAEATDKHWARKGSKGHWGPRNPRRMILGEWSKPAQWNASAKAAGEIHRVFCASMCDLFEDYDGPVVDQTGNPVALRSGAGNWTVPLLRDRVFSIIDTMPNLLWLLLTKRPENIRRMVPAAWHNRWPTNVMTGTSPCDQDTANECVPALLHSPGQRHFLSIEPLLGPVSICHAVIKRRHGDPQPVWVIVGGESGGGARPCNVAWIREIVRQCKAAGVPVFVKQLGANVRWDGIQGGYMDGTPNVWPEGTKRESLPGEFRIVLQDKKGGDMAEWPKDLRVREMPNV
jgi:protein gp37